MGITSGFLMLWGRLIGMWCGGSMGGSRIRRTWLRFRGTSRRSRRCWVGPRPRRRLDRVLEVDPTSLAARIQAGATGPGLEDQLREHGLTLRHFPQSFEYSTLGGWIATRAGGHFATLYTHIDDLVESVRAVTLQGGWESRRLPASGAGPSPDRMLLGSEGILGVIVDAWVRVRQRPTQKLSVAVASDKLATGAQAVREISWAGLYPSNCRLLDAVESDTSSAGPAGKAVLVLGFESAHHPVEEPMALATEAARA